MFLYNETSVKTLVIIIIIVIVNSVTSKTIETNDEINKDKSIKDVNVTNYNTNKEKPIEDVSLTGNVYDEAAVENVTCVGDAEYCNMSREEYTEMLNDYIYPKPYEWVLIATHSVVFVVGLVGNALVCIAVYKNHTMRTVTNYFIVNLAVADFMVILLCLPPTVVWDVTETWFFGKVMCKILLYFQSVSVMVAVMTLTFISVDRWYAICFPLRFKSTTGRAKTAILVIWTISLIFNCPDLIVMTTMTKVPLRFNLQYLVQCASTWSEKNDLVWYIVKAVFVYLIPLLLITVAYHQIAHVLWHSKTIPGRAETVKLTPSEQTQLRSRRKAAKMLVAVVIMFAVCYLPVHLLSILTYSMDMKQNDQMTLFGLVSHVLCYANSAINPLIYNFMCGKFRREFRKLFCCSTQPALENSTTLTLISKFRKPSDLLTFNQRSHTTSSIKIGYRNGCT
ncbi:orexin/Hypocretin receptor type 1-like [Choristoneura fumiferana]|uniref:orexin/Hypocretin receptor type 1-like n=1 Tax=Choristoneura fumiferana TaxID=7141 RepID=UPI003D15B5A1